MKLISAVLIFSLSSLAMASCPDLAKKAVSSYKKTTSGKFSNVMKHYRAEIAQDSEFKPFIEDASAYIKGQKLAGFEVNVSMGGDEDSVRYVLNEKKEIIVAYWSNQSPVTFWFCGKGKVISEEETEEGSEI